MINIRVTKKSEVVCEITFKGHALYDDFGKDIVCASVSSIMITTVNGIIRVKKDAIVVKQKDKKVTLSDISNDEVTQVLLVNMLDLLKQLANEYPKNVIVKNI